MENFWEVLEGITGKIWAYYSQSYNLLAIFRGLVKNQPIGHCFLYTVQCIDANYKHQDS